MTLAKRIVDLSILWKQASVIFPYFDRRDLDWDDAYLKYLPKIIDAKSDREYHLLLAEFLNLLGDGHTDYTPPKSLLDAAGYLPFTLRYIQNSYCIDASIPAFGEYVGSAILSINEVPFPDFIADLKRFCYHAGSYIPAYRLHQLLPLFLKETQNHVHTTAGHFVFDLQPSKPERFTPKPLLLPIPHRPITGGKLDIRLYHGDILYIRLDDFMDSNAAEEVRSAILKARRISGMILDLRENIGGMTMYGARIAELLISGRFNGCQKRTRSMTGIGLSSASQVLQWSPETTARQIAAGSATQEEIEESKSYAANAHFDHYIDTYGVEGLNALYSGPCVILTSRNTVSAAEDFVAMFRSNQRATIIGTETCGTTGTPFLQKLSSGGRARICSVAYRLLDGTEFIGCGIKPDFICEISREDFERGYDFVLNEGLTFLEK